MRDFYTPVEAADRYDEIVPVYQTAFAGEPWFEVSKCADDAQRCEGGFSALEVGVTCATCGQCATRPAYEADELTARFDALATSRPTSWYLENVGPRLGLCAIAWTASARQIGTEKYQAESNMQDWLQRRFGEQRIGWLDEVFADRTLRRSGNLNNFRDMCLGFMARLGVDTLAYRTINERMVSASRTSFGAQAIVLPRWTGVPDRRDFVVLRSGSENV